MTRKLAFIELLVFTVFFQSAFADYPIVSHRYLADPGALVYNGRVYIYCSNDDQNPVEGGYKMHSVVCVSSSDMKNWTDHGIVFQVPEDASWASKSWAPSPATRDGKFYLYFGNGGNGIGVAVADNPLGPFIDPIGNKLVSSRTPGVLPAKNMWLFDPMTFVDDDGQAYMYFGGNGENNMRVIKLNNDMISIKDSALQFNVPYFFEASWVHKHNNKYYFSYSTNPQNGMRIDYMISNNPLTGFTYGGIMSLQPPYNDNNNHQTVFELKGKSYQVYHNRIVAKQAGIPANYRRNLCVDQLFYNEDGTIRTMKNTIDGITQLGHMNPFKRVEAETINAQSGIETEKCNNGGMDVTNIENGDWIKVKGVDFESGATSFTAVVASGIRSKKAKKRTIEIHIDDLDGTLIGTVPVLNTGGSNIWKSKKIKVKTISGVHDVFFVFTGGENNNLFNFDYWSFSKK